MMIEISGAKLAVAFWGGIVAFLFAVIFALFYFGYFRNDQFSKKLFYISASSLFALAFLKLVIFYMYPYNYIADRLVFYAIPSPKALGWLWLAGTTLLFMLFLRFRERMERVAVFKFLFALYVFFVFFSIGVAAVREGFFSVYEPFTRTHFEYTGNLYLIRNTSDFLKNFIDLSQSLSIHTRIHPPGYTLILYFFQKYLHAGFGGMAALTVMLGGLAVFPLYYFLKNFATERETRRGLELFVFFPSFAMMSATSMDAVFLFFVWIAIFLIYAGWMRSAVLSFLGGVAAAAALFLNYLFLLAAPLFLILLFMVYGKSGEAKRLIFRTAAAVAGLALFFAALYLVYDYSIWENFWVSRAAQNAEIKSNFESLLIYFVYFFMNLSAFAVYLGLPNVFLLVGRIKEFWRRENLAASLGFIMVGLFLLMGIFQGEVERIWLFLTPLFILPLMKIVKDWEPLRFNALLSLLFFQIITLQILFYTYW